MIQITNNDALGIVKGLLSFFKRNTVLLLIEKIFSLIPFKAWLWHFMIPYRYVGQYSTPSLSLYMKGRMLPQASGSQTVHDDKQKIGRVKQTKGVAHLEGSGQEGIVHGHPRKAN